MRHFLFEFITGGGLAGQPLSESLIKEGEIMLQTLLHELSDIKGQKIFLARDSRLNSVENVEKQVLIKGRTEEQLIKVLKESDVSWLIAPETNNFLLDYAKLFVEHGCLFVGSSPEAIKLTASKFFTNEKLSEIGVNVVDTRWLRDGFFESENGWVVKPDDGVGAEDAFLVHDKNKLIELIDHNEVENTIVQPYVKGLHLSMSLLVFEGEFRLLACNKQYIQLTDDSIKLIAIGVNEALLFKNDMLMLAKKIVSAISGLAGYIGVDLIASEGGLTVLEINPRFTTAYAGISESINCNVTSKILSTFLNKKLPCIELSSAKSLIINV